MRIIKLSLKNFRNHSFIEISPQKGINVFLGANGKGKTALLEAFSLIFLKKSFRKGRNWIQKGQDQSVLSLDFENSEGRGLFDLSLFQSSPSQFKLNGKKSKGLFFKNNSVFFTPEDLNAFRGGTLYRRRLVDDLVLDLSGGYRTLKEFQTVLVQRNRFLKLCKKGSYSFSDKKHHLEALNQIFLKKSAALVESRIQALKEFKPFWRKRGFEFLKERGFETCYVDQEGRSLETKDSFTALLKKDFEKKRAIEERRSLSLSGPHLHDLRFLWKGYEASEELSQGQQKALLLSWKLGQWDQNFYRKKQPPALFLDDVFSEIDQHFRSNLIEFLLSNQAQSFITATEAKEPLQNAKIFHLGA